MRILLASHSFSPDVGGIETASLMLAREWATGGHDVTVITQSAGAGDFPFEVVRRPSAFQTWRAVRDAEVVVQNNPSLRTGWPLQLLRRPWVVVVATWIARADGKVSWRDRLKRISLRRAQLVSVSGYVAEQLGLPSVVVHNGYDAGVFNRHYDIARNRQLVVVARLVSDKGVDILLRAVRLLHDSGRFVELSVVGDGPDRPKLTALASQLKISNVVEFLGVLHGIDLARELNRYEVMVVPSQWPEPFGIVALEGMACGCSLVATPRGGLPEAVGLAGLVASDASPQALAAAIRMAMDPGVATKLRASASEHLRGFESDRVAQAYLDLATTTRSARSRSQ